MSQPSEKHARLSAMSLVARPPASVTLEVIAKVQRDSRGDHALQRHYRIANQRRVGSACGRRASAAHFHSHSNKTEREVTGEVQLAVRPERWAPSYEMSATIRRPCRRARYLGCSGAQPSSRRSPRSA